MERCQSVERREVGISVMVGEGGVDRRIVEERPRRDMDRRVKIVISLSDHHLRCSVSLSLSLRLSRLVYKLLKYWVLTMVKFVQLLLG